MNINRFQIQIATGRFTFPVVVLVCLLLWGISFQGWKELISLGITALVSYFIIETNTSFTLIRTRTSLPVCIYGLLASGLFFLHPYEGSNWIPLVFMLIIHQLFQSYESPQPTNFIYHAFLLTGLGSLVFPPFMYLIPLWWGSMIPFRTMNVKSILASLIGTVTPYWFLFGYAFHSDKMQLFFAPLQEMIHLSPIHYESLTLSEIVSWTFVTLLFTVCGFHYWLVSYKDRTRTRIYHSFLIIVGLWITLLSILQPAYLHQWMSIQLICSAYLAGHLFTLTRNRFSGIFFIVIFVSFISLVSYNLWMLFFNS